MAIDVNENITIDLRDLAEYIVNKFPLLIQRYEIEQPDFYFDDIQEYIEKEVGTVTPCGYIITEACLEHLCEDLESFIFAEVELRIKYMREKIEPHQKEALKEQNNDR